MEFISGRDILAILNRLRKERRIMSVGQADADLRCCKGKTHRRLVTGVDRSLVVGHRVTGRSCLIKGHTRCIGDSSYLCTCVTRCIRTT